MIDVDFDVKLENRRHRFCHHRLSLWMQLMKPQWNGPLLRSCIWSVLLWRCFFFTFWSGIALMSLLWRPGATKILPPIPAIEGSVKQDLSLFAQISFFIPNTYFYLGAYWSQSFSSSSRHTTSFPWYTFSFMLYLINAEMLCIFHCLDLFLYICRDFYLNIWWKGPT